jgi:hypothetical protein
MISAKAVGFQARFVGASAPSENGGEASGTTRDFTDQSCC